MDSAHRLVAIMFTDIVGYSAMMQQDRNMAHSQAKLHEQVIRIHVEKYNGNLHQFYGDGSLTTFQNTTDAVNCARDIQIYLHRQSYIPLRIGIHVGEVIHEADQIYGDGINIASRIESSGHAGAILLSHNVRDKIRNDPSLETVSLGAFQFKNIEESLSLFALADANIPPVNVDLLTNKIRRSPGDLLSRPGSQYVKALVFVGLGVAGGFLLSRSGQDHARSHLPATSSIIQLDDDKKLYYAFQSAPLSISDDGTAIVYVGESGATDQLYIRLLHSSKIRRLPGTQGARHPVFSPDGEHIAFFQGDRLRKMALSGGPPITLATATGIPNGIDWAPDGRILYCLGGASVYAVSDDGGEPDEVSITALDGDHSISDPAPSGTPSIGLDGIRLLRYPQHVSRDLILITAGYADEGGYLGLLDTGSGSLQILTRGSQGKYLKSGILVFSTHPGVLNAVGFDLGKRRMTGSLVPPIEDVFRGPGSGSVNFSISDQGTLVYTTGGFHRFVHLVDQNGRTQLIDIPARGFRLPKAAPDGSKIALAVDPRPSNIWILDLASNNVFPVTSDADGHNVVAAWSKDSQRLIMSSPSGVLMAALSDNYRPRKIDLNTSILIFPGIWTTDNNILWNETFEGGASYDILTVNLEEKKVEKFWGSAGSELSPNLSPDEQWLAFSSDFTGTREVFLIAYPVPGIPIQISKEGGTEPNWSHDSQTLFYREGDKIISVDVGVVPPVNEPTELFKSIFDHSELNNWDVLPNGDFVMIQGDPSTRSQIHLIQNWTHAIADVRE